MSDKSLSLKLSRRNIQRVFGTPFTDGNRVTLVWEEKDSFQNIFDAVRNAREFVCMQFYIFRDDETGREMAEILKKKASEGVKVYILYDHFGCIWTPKKFWRVLRESGIHISASRPFKWSSPFHYVHRDHRKLIIVDGIIAFTGGLNIANEYRGYHITMKRRRGWRDTGVILEGPIASTLFETFKKSWEIWKGEIINIECHADSSPDGIPVLPIFASSAKGRRKMRKLIYYSINNAQRSIYLTTAYFTPSRRMIHILESAVKRGVDVKILLPGKSDVTAAFYAARAFFTRLLKAGIEIYTYEGEILHAKTYVFDGVWSIIGSANLDFQSLRRNDEGNVGIIDADFGRKMCEIFFEDLNRSSKVDLENWKKRPLLEKFREHFFSIFRRRL